MLSNFQTMHSVLLPTTHTVERSYLYLAICRIDSIDLVVHGRYSTLHNWHGNDSPPSRLVLVLTRRMLRRRAHAMARELSC